MKTHRQAFQRVNDPASRSSSASPILGRGAGKEKEVNAKTEAGRASEAATVLTTIMGIPDNAIPEELMARAHGIAVIPHVVKGAFGLGGQWGKGLAAQRREDGSWTAPHTFKLQAAASAFNSEFKLRT
jgi:lipid-binding SYLF domain-containing protein